MVKHFTFFLIFLLFIGRLYAQDIVQNNLSTRYGIFGNFNLNQHYADFRALPGVPSCCPQFNTGTGNGLTLGGLFEFPFSNIIALQLRANFSSQNAILQKIEDDTISINFLGDSPLRDRKPRVSI